jgi:hypothetical protein
MGSSFDIVFVDGDNIVGAKFSGTIGDSQAFVVDVQKTCYRNEQLEQLFDSMWVDLT